MGTDVTDINAAFLNKMKSQLNDILTEVQAQLKGIGQAYRANATFNINPVDSTLGVTIQAGGVSFDAAAELKTALNKMGGSVHEQLEWLRKVLSDMILEITDTVTKFTNNETLNKELVEKLITEFQLTINDMSPQGMPQLPNS